jgi:hypothetical protein
MSKKNEIAGALADLMGSTSKATLQKHKSEDERLAGLPKDKTVTVSFRVLSAERERLEKVFREAEGVRLAEGVKRAVYAYIRTLQTTK